MRLTSPITECKGVGNLLAKKFAQVGVNTVADLIDYYPRRYDDYSEIVAVNQLHPGKVTIAAEIRQVNGRYARRGMHVTEAVASDETGSVRLVWFNQPYRAGALKIGQRYFIAGDYGLRRGHFSLLNPAMEKASELTRAAGRIVPVYREAKGLTSRQIRGAVSQIVPLMVRLPETLPTAVVREQRLLARAEALRAIHVPASVQELEAARRRLGFEEVFQLSLAALLNKQANQAESTLAIPFDAGLARTFVGHLPFRLTDAQRRALWHIYRDLQKPQPMNRLLEGDVGSGKTAVASLAALMVIAAGHQVALMAPTELLARQHAETVYELLEALGRQGDVALLVGSLTSAQKTQARAAIKRGQARFIIGTQALIQDQVDMRELALVIIDEQHRFGVEQRKRLMHKAGRMPHVLSLTATPIPRSLALVVYGELDISLLDEKPAGRQPVVTELVSPNSRARLYKKIDDRLAAGHQMFVVCPAISPGATDEVESVEKVYEQLSQHDFKYRRVGLLHGKLKAAEKQSVMRRFQRHQLDILVATTVIEVGIDVPNANIMLIQGAERFGLAQLHQLRGRVGRGQAQAHCYVMPSDSRPPSRLLRAFVSSKDGFRLAELDLKLRGPGAIYGTSQHGQIDLRIAELTDTALIAAARQAAQKLLDSPEDLLQYKQLMTQVNRLRAVTNLN